MKFREFKTKSGTLVLAGKNAENNEELVKQISPEEIVLHTAKPGSPFVNIKGKAEKEDVKESAIFCASKSQDWRDNKADVVVHIFNGKDIKKVKGMPVGTFAVKKAKSLIVKKADITKFIGEKK